MNCGAIGIAPQHLLKKCGLELIAQMYYFSIIKIGTVY